MKKNNENFKQLELFQDTKDYQNEFETAREAKHCIQNTFSTFKLDVDIDNVANLSHQFFILNFKVKVTQLSNKPEPNSPKLFMRKYTPILEIYESKSIGNPIHTKVFTEKTIPKWINEIYVGSIISQELFYELSKQYILLETINKYFDNDFTIDRIISQIKSEKEENQLNSDAKLIIKVCSKLFNRNKINPTNPYITSAINKINNLSNKLTSQSNIVMLGEYLNYRFESDLIIDIDNSSSINNCGLLGSFYQNDFLLLNNMEFLSEKPYTKDWIPLLIFPPQLLKIHQNEIKSMEYAKSQKLFFAYQKVNHDGLFFRNEFYIPSKFILKDYFWDMIIMSRELLKRKEYSANGK